MSLEKRPWFCKKECFVCEHKKPHVYSRSYKDVPESTKNKSTLEICDDCWANISSIAQGKYEGPKGLGPWTAKDYYFNAVSNKIGIERALKEDNYDWA